MPLSTVEGDGVGPSEGVRFRLFDPETNRPVAQFSIGRYRRAGERTVALTDVRVVARVDGGAVAVIESPRGTVEVEPPASGRASQIDADALTHAQSARLEQVVLRWYADAADLAADRPATATLTVDNVVFDYARYVLSTGDTTVDDQTVLADDVRVTVASDDYTFVGYGLTIEWDPEAGRPELVRVARGESLVFTKPPTLLRGAEGAESAAVARPERLASGRLSSHMLQADGAVEVEEAEEIEEITPYAVTLQEDLAVAQDGQTLLSGDRATLYIPLAFESAPAEEPKPRASPRKRRPAEPSPAREPEAPVVVTWSGPLTLVPAGPEIALADREDSKAELVGSPLVAWSEGSRLVAGRLWFERSADRLEIDGHNGANVRFEDADGNALEAPRLVAAPDAGTATALGAGRASLPGESDEPPTTLAWSRQCGFVFETVGAGGDGRQVLRRLEPRGEVDVSANGLALTSDALDVTLADATDDAPAAVEAVAASGNVYCLVNAGGADEATFRAEQLWLSFPEGPDGPIEATAEGGVSTVQADGQMRGDRLTATIANDAEGKPQLRSLRVTGNVVATDADGQTVRGDSATIDGEGRPLLVTADDGERATIEAAMEGANVRIDAPVVVLDPGDGSIATRDGGLLVSRQAHEDGTWSERRAAWTGTFTATSQRVDLVGGVTASGALQGESTFELSADTVGVALRDAPKDDEQAEALADVEQVDLAGGVRLRVEYPGETTGRRTFDLQAERLAASPATEALDIPVPGRALYTDDRPKPADAEADTTFRGNAAFGWSGRLAFDPLANELRMTGDATVVVEPAGRSPFRLVGDAIVVATVQSDKGRQVERATIAGNVRLEPSQGGQSVECDLATYDPASGRLTAVGTDGRSVRVFDEAGVPIGQFGRVVYDVASGRIEEMVDLRSGG